MRSYTIPRKGTCQPITNDQRAVQRKSKRTLLSVTGPSSLSASGVGWARTRWAKSGVALHPSKPLSTFHSENRAVRFALLSRLRNAPHAAVTAAPAYRVLKSPNGQLGTEHSRCYLCLDGSPPAP